jgi:hypothetical protein
MTTTTPKLLTSRNSPALARIKQEFNSRIYAVSRRVLNEGGMDALRVYLRQFFNDENKHEADRIIDGPVVGPDPDAALAPSPTSSPEVDAYRAVAAALEAHGWALVLESLQVAAEIRRLRKDSPEEVSRFVAVRDQLVAARELL